MSQRSAVRNRTRSNAAAAEASPQPAQGGHHERLVAAMASSIEEKGYRNTSVADVVRLARTSRRSYYEHFADRDACFLALFDATNEAMMQRIAAAVQPQAPWEQQVDAAIGAYLDSVAARPALCQSFAWELPALARAGAARERAVVERFAALLVALVESGRRKQPQISARPLTRDTAIVMVGGLRELTVSAFEQGRDVQELRATAASVVKGILRAAVGLRSHAGDM
jgi:AcrR family transcriptional regulator